MTWSLPISGRGDSVIKLVQLYVSEIRAGNITIDDVPAGLRAKVEAALAAEDQGNGVV